MGIAHCQLLVAQAVVLSTKQYRSRFRLIRHRSYVSRKRFRTFDRPWYMTISNAGASNLATVSYGHFELIVDLRTFHNVQCTGSAPVCLRIGKALRSNQIQRRQSHGLHSSGRCANVAGM